MMTFLLSIALAQAPAAAPATVTSVDFLVTTDDGTPVADVAADAVTVKIDGKPA